MPNSNDNYLIELKNFMAAEHLPCDDEVYLDGKIHRYSCRGKKDKDEWYFACQLDDGHIFCIFGSWRAGVEKKVYKSFHHIVDANKLMQYQQQMQEKQKEFERNLKQDRERAYENMCEFWTGLFDSSSNAYLLRKGVQPYKVRQHEDLLVIPLQNIDGELETIQKISPDGTKRFFPGLPTIQTFFVFGSLEGARRARFAEGYATAASIWEATGEPVIACFSDRNIINCAIPVKNRYPQLELILCQDLGKAGDIVAKTWRKEINDNVLKPRFPHTDGKGKDFNDLHQECGIEELKKQTNKKKINTMAIERFLMKDIKPIEWTIENLIVNGSVNMVFGEAGIGKSFFCYEMACCIHAGYNFMVPNWKTHQKRVVYVDGEMSHSEIKERFENIFSRYPTHREKFSKEQNLFILTSEMVEEQEFPPLDLYNPECRQLLDEVFEENDVIFLDNFSNLTFIIDDDYENKASSWAQIGRWFNKWKRKGKTIILVHHANKIGGSRGTSRMDADFSTIIQLSPSKEPNPEYHLMFDAHIKKGRHIISKNKSSRVISLVDSVPWDGRWRLNYIESK